MAEDTDFHIDTKLENLFHPDSPGLQLEDGGEDDITAEKLPEWLIGVIVVIILLVIAFFVMVLSSIIKNKRKNRSAGCSDNSSTSHICDDLELGKIDQVDPSYQVTTCVQDGKNPDSGTSPVEEFMSSSCQALTEASSSSASNDGSQSLCGCKNPLFVDDEPEGEKGQETDCSEEDGKIDKSKIERCCKSKGQFHKHKNSKSVCKDLKSVDELYDEEKLNADLTRLNEMKENKKENSTSISGNQDVTTQSNDEAEHDDKVMVHNSEVTSSKSPGTSSKIQSPVLGSASEDEVETCNADLETTLNVFDASMDSHEENTDDPDMEKSATDIVAGDSGESCEAGEVVAGPLEPKLQNTLTESENDANSKTSTTANPDDSKTDSPDDSNSNPTDCSSYTNQTDKLTGHENSNQAQQEPSSSLLNGDVLELENDERAFTKL